MNGLLVYQSMAETIVYRDEIIKGQNKGGAE
jgi:hypothetical protein